MLWITINGHRYISHRGMKTSKAMVSCALCTDSALHTCWTSMIETWAKTNEFAIYFKFWMTIGNLRRKLVEILHYRWKNSICSRLAMSPYKILSRLQWCQSRTRTLKSLVHGIRLGFFYFNSMRSRIVFNCGMKFMMVIDTWCKKTFQRTYEWIARNKSHTQKQSQTKSFHRGKNTIPYVFNELK